MKSGIGSFSMIAGGVGAGFPIPDGWTPVTACECLVLVGLTGVGKSTVLAQLAERLDGSTSLPDRRELTDQLMIPTVQSQRGEPLKPVTDRARRFELTAQYRTQFPAGMTHALSSLAVAPTAASALLLFDGLRGENEVRHAAALLPRARFVMLDAPDIVRIQRLVARQDAFDRVAADPVPLPSNEAGAAVTTASLGVPELAEILNADEQQVLLRWIRDGAVSSSDLAGKARIIIAERRNYDPAATRAALLACADDRSFIVDTEAHSPPEIAASVAKWLDG